MFWFVVGLIALFVIITGIGISLLTGGFFAYMAYIGMEELGVTSQFVKMLMGAVGFVLGLVIGPALRELVFRV